MNPIKKVFRYAVKNGLLTEGKNWYIEAHNFAFILSQTYQINLDKVCGIVAALSPGVTWEQNKRDAEVLAQAYDLNLHNEVRDHHYFSTYGQNVMKAIDILNSDFPPINFFSKEQSGHKTKAFYLNILNPIEDGSVTIDRHALAIAEGYNTSKPRSLTKNQYRVFEAMYKTAASQLGLIPSQLQAVTWVAYKHAQDNDYKLFK